MTRSSGAGPRRKALRVLTGVASLMLVGAVQAGDFACCADTELDYFNGDVQLAGVLLRPMEQGRYPAAVLIQGSGDSDRSNQWARFIAESLVTRGVAVLLTDKRGTGESGGTWRTSSFQDLANDALAGVDALRSTESIRADRVGLLGLSQGGHIAPLAATQGEVAFVISLVASTLPPKDTLVHELQQTYRQHGLNESQIEFLQQMTTLSFAYIETGEGLDEYLAYRRKVKSRFGPMAVETWPDSPDSWYWTFWGNNYDEDPMPRWREVVDVRQIPTFIAFGALDELDNVPVKASVERLENELQGNSLTLKVYPGTGHSLMNEALIAQGEFKWVDGFSDDLDRWIEKNLRP